MMMPVYGAVWKRYGASITQGLDETEISVFQAFQKRYED